MQMKKKSNQKIGRQLFSHDKMFFYLCRVFIARTFQMVEKYKSHWIHSLSSADVEQPVLLCLLFAH